jgi:hypothetical protein
LRSAICATRSKGPPRTCARIRTTHGFGDWFRKQVAAAGLGNHCVAHGLRKAACHIMAENNCTAHEIKSVSGHYTLKEVELYTDAVNL